MKNPHIGVRRHAPAGVRSHHVRKAMVAFAAVAASLGVVASASAVAPQHADSHAASGRFPAPSSRFYAPDSLAALAAPLGLRIGNALNITRLDDPAYDAIAGGQFSVITPENAMKWDAVEPTQGVEDFSGGDQVVAFAKAHHQLVRGHTLLWHNQIPAWLTTGVDNGTIDNTELMALVRKHILDEVGHFRGEIWQWDVANEFLTDSDPSMIDPTNFWIQHLGVGIIADAFRWAHQADPHALLFYNDYNIAGEDGSNAKSDAAYAFVKSLLAQHVPIDGVGDQGHLDTQFGFNGQLMEQDLARFAGLGLKVAITEADVRTFVDSPTTQNPTDALAPTAQSQEYTEMLNACLEVRQCISFTTWDVDDADSWVLASFPGEGAATLYDVNLQPKPEYTAVQQTLELAQGAPHHG